MTAPTEEDVERVARERVAKVIIDRLYVGDALSEWDYHDVDVFADAVLAALGVTDV